MKKIGKHKLFRGDCLKILKKLPDNSIDSIVTDPPYGLKFMAKKWDHDVPQVAVWKECLRVLKPGGYLLAFAGTRTQHRMAVNIEDSGFAIVDILAWVYSSGFPKSQNISKALTKAVSSKVKTQLQKHAEKWQGFGTAVKPAFEPITMARKPLEGTYVANILKHGVGALNIDGCRVHSGGPKQKTAGVRTVDTSGGWGVAKGGSSYVKGTGAQWTNEGRFPANLIHDGSDEVRHAFPEAPGQQGDLKGHSKDRKSKGCYGDMKQARDHAKRVETDKSAARFFYVAKASKKDRDEGNNHITVKPRALMRYLVRLVTPIGGTCLDPYMGSGTTLVACEEEGCYKGVGIELLKEHFTICKMRVRKARRLNNAKAESVKPIKSQKKTKVKHGR